MEGVSAMAKAMTRLANDPQLRNTLGAAGRIKAGHFGWDSIADQYLDAYRACGAADSGSQKTHIRSNPTDVLVGSR
jgi:glycosyltransferase involved in cell wall biosynthesis